MATVQVKGTKQEVLEMLQLFRSFRTDGMYTVEIELDGERSKPEKQRHEYEAQEEQNRHFVCQMLTGVYND